MGVNRDGSEIPILFLERLPAVITLFLCTKSATINRIN